MGKNAEPAECCSVLYQGDALRAIEHHYAVFPPEARVLSLLILKIVLH
ncbi:MAG: hypothetical protein LAT84_13490 [Balneolia bacterium]|nr:hypothetical protein [Balneolia bacterium]